MKVLVIKIAAIGDFLMATPALRALKLAPTVDSLALLAGASIADAVKGNPHLDQVFFLNDAKIFKGGFWEKLSEVLKVSRRLRRERFDLGFNFQRDWRFSIILLLAGCKRRIGFAPRRGRGRFLLSETVPVEGVRHTIFRYCDLVRRIGVFCMDFAMEFPLAPGAAEAAAEKFPAAAGNRSMVVLVPGGAVNVKQEMSSRRWDGANFAALAGMLLHAGHAVALLGNGGDAAIAAAIRAAQPGVIDLTGKTSLAEAAAVMKMARLVICNDSGLMHLAATMNTPLIAIFGPTPVEELKPLTENSVTVWKGQDLGCAPCYRDGVFPVCGHRTCLQRISPQEIFELAKTLL
ncbi:MAG: lipopolysaccharide heptosyltransferase II [Candidatus Aminicenantes bacterium]|nr:lipopolysaccharide heptosyltransferase II [Candidatus Aminicenantes bacterium]